MVVNCYQQNYHFFAEIQNFRAFLFRSERYVFQFCCFGFFVLCISQKFQGLKLKFQALKLKFQALKFLFQNGVFNLKLHMLDIQQFIKTSKNPPDKPPSKAVVEVADMVFSF